MSGKLFSPRLSATCCLLASVFFGHAASAEYNYYQQPANSYAAHQNAGFQQAAFRGQMNHHQNVIMPPVIMPYIPFDDKPVIQQQVVNPQPLQHYQPPVNHQASINHHQPQARTWRQAPAAPSPSHLSNARQQVLRAARRQMGVRYRWGGNTPRQGFDCSGFTKHAMNSSNISIPRTAAQQSRASRTIKRSQLRPGDMIFFKTKGRRVNHVGIYLGNGRFIHAASGGGKVMTDDLRKAYWQKRLHKYGTFLS